MGEQKCIFAPGEEANLCTPHPLPSLHPSPPPLPPSTCQCVEHLEIVRTACRELQGCASFSKLLQAVLELGNHLNQVGACRGSRSSYVFACD